MRTIAVVTVARSDYSIYLPLLRRIQADRELHLRLIVSGAHLSPEFGMSVNLIEADGFAVADRVEILVSSDSPEGTSKSIGLGVIGFSEAFARSRPDLLVVLGDRFEMYAAAVAALPFTIPVVHIHGGEVTIGAIDDALRHSMTKLSHVHFVATAEYGRRVRQLGEEPDRIIVSGAPSLDNVSRVTLLSAGEMEARFGCPTQSPFLLVTFHPATLENASVTMHTQALLDALDDVNLPVVFTQPNADAGAREIERMIDDFVRKHPTSCRVDSFGLQGYFSAMNLAAAMVGNSSSGIIEAMSFGLPVVNIGMRQTGRLRAGNVIDVKADRMEIAAAIQKAVRPEFREGFRGAANPYGDGHASRIIYERIKSIELGPRLTTKRFHDLSFADAPDA
jgi:UDP-hydrolysing UDP-N-acetyl-D-glucosamine 2-epimerase